MRFTEASYTASYTVHAVEILNRLIDRQLAKQQAIKSKLDRTPKVILAIEAAKKETLARAYQEQIPLEILPKVQAMKAGQVLRLEFASDRFHVIRLETSKAAPVDEATATPRVQQFLSNRNSSEAIAKKMKKLKELTRIEYLGEFAGAMAEAEAKPKPEAEAQPKSEESPKELSQKITPRSGVGVYAAQLS